MRQDLFAHLLRLPPVWYRRNRVGDLMSRAVNDLSAVRMLLGPGIMQAGNTLLVGTVSLILMFRVSPALTGVALAVFPVIAVATKVMGQATHKRFTKIQEFFSEISAEAQENFTGQRLVRAFAREASEEARFDANNHEFRRRNLGLARLNALFFPLLQFLVAIGFALTLWAGGRFILAGKLTVARYVEFNLYMMELIWPAIALGWVVNLWQRGTASWNRMMDVWEATPLPEEAEGGAPLAGDVEFRAPHVGLRGPPRPRGRVLPRPARRHRRDRRPHRLGQVDAPESPAARRRPSFGHRPRRRPRPRERAAAARQAEPRRRAPGDVPLLRHARRERRVRASRRLPSRGRGGRRSPPASRPTSRASRRASTRSSASAGSRSRAARSSARRSRARSSRMRRSSSSTTRSPPSTRRPRRASSRGCAARPAAGPSSSSPTGSRRSATPTSSSSSTAAGWPRRAGTRSSSGGAGSTPRSPSASASPKRWRPPDGRPPRGRNAREGVRAAARCAGSSASRSRTAATRRGRSSCSSSSRSRSSRARS